MNLDSLDHLEFSTVSADHALGLATFAMTEVFGPVALVGPSASRFVADVVTTHATSIYFLGGAFDVGAGDFGEPFDDDDDDDDAVDDDDDLRDVVLAAAIIAGEPRHGDLLDLTEGVVSRLVAGGLVVVDLPGAHRHRRLRRLLDGLLVDLERPKWADDDRFVLVGRREQGVGELEIAVPEPTSVTLIIVTRDDPDTAVEVCADALFRQAAPPAVVMVVDDGIDGERTVPEDLWGLAKLSVAQPVLLRTEGVGLGAAWDIALEHVETEYVMFLHDGFRLGSGCIRELLGIAELTGAPAVVAARVEVDPDGRASAIAADATDSADLLDAFLAGPGLAPGPALFVTDTLREVGFPADLEVVASCAAASSVAARGELATTEGVVAVEVVSAARSAARHDIGPSALTRFREIHGVDAVCDVTEVRASIAGEWLGLHLLGAGATEEAIDELVAARDREPRRRGAHLALARARWAARDFDVMTKELEAVCEVLDDSLELRMALACAWHLTDRFDEALAVVETCLEDDPESSAAHLGRLVLFAEKSGDSNTRSALAEYVDIVVSEVVEPVFFLGHHPAPRGAGWK